ncbi:hypothetical protein HMPREF3226_00676 [Prevotella corporis]|uniref:Uncharacterized protein n=1 Tax=Prevotella corporis TaxID=28128 RepID=A0A133QHM2_9BACT|nr:hypothetical protein HMPREF3226_00676 [Prevotella corporis]
MPTESKSFRDSKGQLSLYKRSAIAWRKLTFHKSRAILMFFKQLQTKQWKLRCKYIS